MKKKIEKKIFFKNKSILVLGIFLVVMMVIFGTGAALVKAASVKKVVTTICEGKNGELFVPRDKKGNNDECGKHSEAVTFDFGDNNGSVNVGKIMFISDDTVYAVVYVLDDEGRVFTLYRNSGYDKTWYRSPTLDLPSNVSVNDVVFWSRFSFMTRDGDTYFADPDSEGMAGGWIGPVRAPIQ